MPSGIVDGISLDARGAALRRPSRTVSAEALPPQECCGLHVTGAAASSQVLDLRGREARHRVPLLLGDGGRRGRGLLLLRAAAACVRCTAGQAVLNRAQLRGRPVRRPRPPAGNPV